MSRWRRFLPGVGSGTFWNAISTGRVPPSMTTNQPSFVEAIFAPVCSAHQAASGSGSAVSVVIMPSVSVMPRSLGTITDARL
jgi:hypothetical protein